MSLPRKLALAYLSLVGLALLAPVLQPFAFQKINALERADAWPPLSDSGKAVDMDALLGGLEYQKGNFWAVEPEARYRGTIEQGLGNCSQKVFGLAYALDRDAIDFQIVHLLPIDTFLLGQGHTLLRVRYRHDGREQTGLVDLLQGGLPASGERFLDVGDLASAPVPDFHFEVMATGGEDSTRFYGADLGHMVAAFVPAAEVARYYRFLSAVYVPIGRHKLEKYLYDGLAMLLGFYPRVYAVDYDRLFEQRAAECAWHRSSLWALRVEALAAPFLLLAWLGSRRRISRVSSRPTARPAS